MIHRATNKNWSYYYSHKEKTGLSTGMSNVTIYLYFVYPACESLASLDDKGFIVMKNNNLTNANHECYKYLRIDENTV